MGLEPPAVSKQAPPKLSQKAKALSRDDAHRTTLKVLAVSSLEGSPSFRSDIMTILPARHRTSSTTRQEGRTMTSADEPRRNEQWKKRTQRDFGVALGKRSSTACAATPRDVPQTQRRCDAARVRGVPSVSQSGGQHDAGRAAASGPHVPVLCPSSSHPAAQAPRPCRPPPVHPSSAQKTEAPPSSHLADGQHRKDSF